MSAYTARASADCGEFLSFMYSILGTENIYETDVQMVWGGYD